MRRPGVTVAPLAQMNGDAHVTEVLFDDVLVPDADRIGTPGEGWKVAITCLGFERGAGRRRAGAQPGAEGSLAELATNAMVKDLADLGMEAHGPAATVVTGDDRVSEWQTMWGVSPSLSIRGGTDEVQRNIVGERILGLPPEPRVDKERPFDERPDR